jgi:hypothetical protein
LEEFSVRDSTGSLRDVAGHRECGGGFAQSARKALGAEKLQTLGKSIHKDRFPFAKQPNLDKFYYS